MAVHAIPNIEMLNIEMSGTLATAAFGRKGWRRMAEKRHGGSGKFSDIAVSGNVAENGATGGIDNSFVVGHVNYEISAAADTDPGG